jgi:hypothetical protein
MAREFNPYLHAPPAPRPSAPEVGVFREFQVHKPGPSWISTGCCGAPLAVDLALPEKQLAQPVHEIELSLRRQLEVDLSDHPAKKRYDSVLQRRDDTATKLSEARAKVGMLREKVHELLLAGEDPAAAEKKLQETQAAADRLAAHLPAREQALQQAALELEAARRERVEARRLALLAEAEKEFAERERELCEVLRRLLPAVHVGWWRRELLRGSRPGGRAPLVRDPRHEAARQAIRRGMGFPPPPPKPALPPKPLPVAPPETPALLPATACEEE